MSALACEQHNPNYLAAVLFAFHLEGACWRQQAVWLLAMQMEGC